MISSRPYPQVGMTVARVFHKNVQNRNCLRISPLLANRQIVHSPLMGKLSADLKQKNNRPEVIQPGTAILRTNRKEGLNTKINPTLMYSS